MKPMSFEMIIPSDEENLNMKKIFLFNRINLKFDSCVTCEYCTPIQIDASYHKDRKPFVSVKFFCKYYVLSAVIQQYRLKEDFICELYKKKELIEDGD